MEKESIIIKDYLNYVFVKLKYSPAENYLPKP